MLVIVLALHRTEGEEEGRCGLPERKQSLSISNLRTKRTGGGRTKTKETAVNASQGQQITFPFRERSIVEERDPQRKKVAQRTFLYGLRRACDPPMSA